jgi:hypothetical protein
MTKSLDNNKIVRKTLDSKSFLQVQSIYHEYRLTNPIE